MPIIMGAIAAATGTEWSSSDWSEADWRADIVFDRSICDGAILTRLVMDCVKKLSDSLRPVDLCSFVVRMKSLKYIRLLIRIKRSALRGR